MSYEINTFVGLGSPGLDSKEEYRLQYRRADITAKFIKEQDCDMSVVLDVAGPSEIGKAICDKYRLGVYAYDRHSSLVFNPHKLLAGTSGDLDGVWWPQTGVVQTVLMTEVLEHILNPLNFMKELKEAVVFDDLIMSWPNRPSWLWTRNHFHEMDIHRFRYLCKLSGYEIIRVMKRAQPETWYNRFRGIRPFFRSFCNRHYWAHLRPIR
jgi:hypothetical protein